MFFVCVVQVYDGNSQDNTCPEYKHAYDSLLQIRNSDPINYEKHQLKSNEAASYLEVCLKNRTDRGVVSDTEFVETTYMIGKLFRDGGNCRLAYDYFLKCMANTMSTRLDHDYYSIANVLKNTCIVQDVFASARGDNYRVRIINYSGKGGLNRNYFLNDIDLNEFTDNTPYFSDEIETLARRKFPLSDTSNAISQLREASNASCFVYKKPFLLLLVTGIVYENVDYPKLSDVEEWDGVMMQDTYEQNKRQASVDYLENFYQNLIEPAFTRFSADYFDRFSTDFIIPIYIFDHPFNAEGARSYAKFTERIHFRKAAGKVGYYNHFDGSLVTWINSGGGTFIHEFVHLMMDHDTQTDRIPYWLNEGTASLYEETRNFQPQNNWRLVYIKKSMEAYNSFADISEMLTLDDFTDDYQRLIADAYARYFCKYLYDRGLLDEIYKNICNLTAKPDRNKQIVLIESAIGQPLDSVQLDFACRIRDNNDFGKWNFHEYIDEVGQFIAQQPEFPLKSINIDFTLCPEQKPLPTPVIYLDDEETYPVQQTEPLQNQMQQMEMETVYPNQADKQNQHAYPPTHEVTPNQAIDTREMEQMQRRPLQPEDSIDHQ